MCKQRCTTAVQEPLTTFWLLCVISKTKRTPSQQSTQLVLRLTQSLTDHAHMKRVPPASYEAALTQHDAVSIHALCPARGRPFIIGYDGAVSVCKCSLSMIDLSLRCIASAVHCCPGHGHSSAHHWMRACCLASTSQFQAALQAPRDLTPAQPPKNCSSRRQQQDRSDHTRIGV